jgi:hypothetical protein
VLNDVEITLAASSQVLVMSIISSIVTGVPGVWEDNEMRRD